MGLSEARWTPTFTQIERAYFAMIYVKRFMETYEFVELS